MAYVIADPELMTAAAADFAAVGSNVSAAHMVAAAPTVAVIPAAADEVSTGIAHLFSQHAANYQALAGQAAAFQEQFVQHLTAGAFSYASAEANSAGLLNGLNVIADWFVTPITSFPGSGPLTPEQLLGLALILPIYIPVLLAGEAVILPFVFVGSLLVLPLAIGAGL
jgi:PE family